MTDYVDFKKVKLLNSIIIFLHALCLLMLSNNYGIVLWGFSFNMRNLSLNLKSEVLSPAALNFISVLAWIINKIDNFHQQLEAIQQIKRREVTIIQGYFNSKIELIKNDNFGMYLGKFQIHIRNGSDDKAVQFCITVTDQTSQLLQITACVLQ